MQRSVALKIEPVDAAFRGSWARVGREESWLKP